MFKNYFKVALRTIRKHTFYSVINILGLTVGVLSCLFILLYITDELSYDSFHKDIKRMYRIGLQGRIGGQEINTATSCPPIASTIVRDIPGVEEAIRINNFSNMVFKQGEKSFAEDKILYADSNFFQFFSFTLLEGDPLTALKEPNSIVLTEELEKKYFDGDALGKLITVGNDNKSFKVTGIAAPPPHNSHFTFKAILSTSSNKDYYDSPIWLSNGIYTYYKKNAATNVASVDAKIVELVKKHVGPQIEKFIGVTLDKFLEQGNKYSYVSYPMEGSHLNADWNDEIEPTSNVAYIYVFGSVGVFILLIACINFMNLSTARSAGRAKEVGLRKTLGSFRSQMVGQFLAESMVYGWIAVTIAMLAAYALLPQFNLLSGKALSFDVLLSPVFILGALGLVLIIGLLAGSYPAFYLTGFSAVEVLKGKVRAGMKSKGIRSGLVVFQFSLSIVLIICTTIGYQQIHFLQTRHMGLDKHNVLVINNTGRLKTNQEVFRNSLLTKTGIEKVSFTNNVFPGVNNTTAFRSAGTNQDHIMGTYFADYDHGDVMKFQLTEGRYFSKEYPSDTLAVVLNEAAVKELGYDKPLENEVIAFGGGQNEELHLKIVGVVKDFNFESFKEKVRPMVIRLTKTENNLLIRYSGSSAEVVKETEKLWKEYASGDPFQYSFLDQKFDELFREEQRLSTLFSVFTSLAIFIACLGLFALAAFTAEQRTKEIGIRKAMGATVLSITTLLSKEFTLLVVVSIVIAVVPAWFILDYWLKQFAYRIDVGVGVFIISSVCALLIAWLTVAFHAIKAAMAKPVNSLRYE